jgi:hypothetical protein
MELSAYQAGQFEAQFEYRSFLPEPINHDWVISDPQVLQLLGQADRALGEHVRGQGSHAIQPN